MKNDFYIYEKENKLPYYIWKPLPDITLYELALCISVLIIGDWTIRSKTIEKLPEIAKRHFSDK